MTINIQGPFFEIEMGRSMLFQIIIVRSILTLVKKFFRLLVTKVVTVIPPCFLPCFLSFDPLKINIDWQSLEHVPDDLKKIKTILGDRNRPIFTGSINGGLIVTF